MLKKLLLGSLVAMIFSVNVVGAVPPTFDQQIAKPLTTDTNGNGETVISPNTFGIDANKPLKENIYNLFSPLNNNSVIRRMIRTIMTGVLILYLVWAGVDMMQKSADENGQKKARRSFLYILFG